MQVILTSGSLRLSWRLDRLRFPRPQPVRRGDPATAPGVAVCNSNTRHNSSRTQWSALSGIRAIPVRARPTLSGAQCHAIYFVAVRCCVVSPWNWRHSAIVGTVLSRQPACRHAEPDAGVDGTSPRVCAHVPKTPDSRLAIACGVMVMNGAGDTRLPRHRMHQTGSAATAAGTPTGRRRSVRRRAG